MLYVWNYPLSPVFGELLFGSIMTPPPASPLNDAFFGLLTTPRSFFGARAARKRPSGAPQLWGQQLRNHRRRRPCRPCRGDPGGRVDGIMIGLEPSSVVRRTGQAWGDRGHEDEPSRIPVASTTSQKRRRTQRGELRRLFLPPSIGRAWRPSSAAGDGVVVVAAARTAAVADFALGEGVETALSLAWIREGRRRC